MNNEEYLMEVASEAYGTLGTLRAIVLYYEKFGLSDAEICMSQIIRLKNELEQKLIKLKEERYGLLPKTVVN
jgi:hypothetical protein